MKNKGTRALLKLLNEIINMTVEEYNELFNTTDKSSEVKII